MQVFIQPIFIGSLLWEAQHGQEPPVRVPSSGAKALLSVCTEHRPHLCNVCVGERSWSWTGGLQDSVTHHVLCAAAVVNRQA